MGILVLMMLLATSPDQKADLKAIDDLHKRDIAATKAYDVEALTALWTEEIVSMPPGSLPVVGKKANHERLAAGEAASKTVEITGYTQKWEEITVIGNFAYEWGTFESTVKFKQGGETQHAEFKVLRVLKRMPDGSWKIHRTMWNEIPPPAPAPPPEPKKP